MNNYMNYDWYNYRHINMPNNNTSLFNPKEGFIKGNMFRNLYSQYKNYQPYDITPRNEKEKSMLEIGTMAFASHDLNLYLDLHPEDQSMFMLFQDYRNKTNKLIEEYERRFGPIHIMSEQMNNSFDWSTKKWPWEGENV